LSKEFLAVGSNLPGGAKRVWRRKVIGIRFSSLRLWFIAFQTPLFHEQAWERFIKAYNKKNGGHSVMSATNHLYNR